MLAPRLATRAIGNSNGTILAAAEQQGKIEAYFFEVVIPMATLDIGRFVSAPPRTSEKREFTEQHLLLWHEISQGSQFFKSERQWLDDLRGQIDYISTAEIALDAGETRQLYEQAVSEDLKTFINALRSKGPVGVVLHLVEYQWLLNDVRRAWHAARIFVNHVGEFIEQDAAGRNQAPDHLIRRNFFSRSDRYRVVSLFSLMDEINSCPPLSDFWRKATIDVGNHVQRIKDLSRNHDLVLWEHVTPEQFVQMLIASNSSKAGATVPATAEFSSVRNGLLDIACAESSPFLFSGHHEGFEGARLSRLLFFLLVGLGPCFPAIIHIDVAGTLYAGGNAKARIEEWRNELRKFQVFCFRYRASLERFILRIEHLLEAQTDKKFEEHITGVAVPDWSFSSLGIEGREGMARRSWGQLSDRSDLIELLTGKRPISYTPRSESSLFRDAEGYLNNAQYFLSLIEKVVHSSQISDSQKEGQRL